MRALLWLFALIAAGFGLAWLCRRLGLSRGRRAVCITIMIAGTFLVVGGLWWTAFTECFAENRYPPPPLSWPWSPRREFCSDPNSAAALGATALLGVPTLLVALGALLWSMRQGVLAAGAFLLIAMTPFLPGFYVGKLPYYRLDAYPILHNPYVRPATDQQPARACYAYGIVHGPTPTSITDDTERICVDLKRTEEASELVPEYASLPSYQSTLWRLEWLGKTLTENGTGPGTEYDGLVVENVYTLPGREALEDAFFVRTSP